MRFVITLLCVFILVNPALAALDRTREDFGIPGDISWETEIVPCGTYNSFSEVITRSGSPSQYIRYKAQTPLCVKVPGGNFPSSRQYVILDGFHIFYNGGSAEGKGFFIYGGNSVGIENGLLEGNQLVQTGVPTCSESVGGNSRAAWLDGTNIWMHNNEIHSWQSGPLANGERIRVSSNFIHNNHNGISPKGRDVVFYKNVIWHAPNHAILIEDNAGDVATHAVLIQENLIIEPQESMFMYGGAKYEFIKNTWWDEVAPCDAGIKLLILERSGNTPPSGPLYFYDNAQGGDFDAQFFYRFERPISIVQASDHNYLYRPTGTRNTWARDSDADRDYSLSSWQSTFGLDLHSRMTTQDPLFADPSVYPTPTSYDEAWNRFKPLEGSPLCGAAHDGGDIGAVPCGPCTPRTCQDAGAECGQVSDGCGGYLDCGTCPAGESCGGGGVPNICGVCVEEPEICDALDNDCDDEVDEGYDQDGDNHFDENSCVAAYPQEQLDCDDTDPNRYYGNTEICGNGIDEDCDASNDYCACPDETVTQTCDCHGEIVSTGYCCDDGPSTEPCPIDPGQPLLALDFDKATNQDTAGGFTSFLLETYDAGVGYGWSGLGTTRDDNRDTGGDLIRDFHRAESSTSPSYLIDLEPGEYQLHYYYGDPVFSISGLGIQAEGETLASGLSANAGVLGESVHEINVSDGQLTLRFLKSGSGFWHVNGLEVYPLASNQNGSGGGAAPCDDGTCDAGDNCPALAGTCPDNTCYEPTCTDGCGEAFVANGNQDEGCTGEYVCNGLGGCVCGDDDGDGYGDSACGGLDCDESSASINPEGNELCGNLIDEDCSGAYCRPGDVTEDRVVDVFDLTLIGSRFGCTTGIAENCWDDKARDADADASGAVDVIDLQQVSSHFGTSY